jgi:hypothetical protein
VKIAGNRHARRFEPGDHHGELCVIHVRARIGIPIDRHDPTVTGPFPVQFVKILRVVSQQHPLDGLGEVVHFRIGRSILAELADGYYIVPVAAQNVELCEAMPREVGRKAASARIASTMIDAAMKLPV